MSLTKAQKLAVIDRVKIKDQLCLNDFSFLDKYHDQDVVPLHKLMWDIRNIYGLGFDGDAFDRHASLRNTCDTNQNFFMWQCPKDGNLQPYKMMCSSFFCNPCHEHYTKRLRMSMMDYIINCNHRLGVFTTPKECWTKINWQNINLLYDVVRQTMSEYFEQTKDRYGGSVPQVGMIAIAHTYGSLDMAWKPHINIFVSTVGFVRCSRKHHYLKRASRLEKSKDDFISNSQCINCANYYQDYKKADQGYCSEHPDFKKFGEKTKPNNHCSLFSPISDADLKKRVYDHAHECRHEYHMVSTAYVDYSKIREIYKKKLCQAFNLKEDFEPQVDWDENLNKADDMFDVAESCADLKPQRSRKAPKLYGVPIKDLLNKMVDYFRRIPLKDDDIKIISNRYIGMTNYKRQALNMSWMFLDPREFYCRIDDHIPKENFRNLRLWGVYHYQNKIRKLRSQKAFRDGIKKPLCPNCKHELKIRHVPYSDDPIGFCCSHCDRLVPFTYYTIGFNKDVDGDGLIPKCKKCGAELQLLGSVIGHRWYPKEGVFLLSNNKLDLVGDFSKLKRGDQLPQAIINKLSEGGLAYG